MTKNIITRRPFFYRDKRMVLSFLMSLPIACFGYLFEAIFMYLATGVLIDWWYFEFKSVKESDVTPQGWLDKVGLTGESFDHHSTVYMWLRHGAFFVSCMAIVADMFFKFDVGYESAFCSMYFTFRLLSGLYLAHKQMIYPWIAAKSQIEGKKYGRSPYPGGYHPLGGLEDPLNPIGFLNPSSPNYISK